MATAQTGAQTLWYDQHAQDFLNCGGSALSQATLEGFAALPELTGVVIQVRWAEVEPEQGVLDPNHIVCTMAEWQTARSLAELPALKFILRFAPYDAGDPNATPAWIYDPNSPGAARSVLNGTDQIPAV